MTPRAQFTRLLWKEYRQVRAFGFLLMGSGITLFLFAVPADPPIGVLPMIAGVLAILFGVASAATGFSNEHENATFLFQRCLPTSMRNVAGAKLGVAIAGSLFIFLTLWALVSVRLVWSGQLRNSEFNLGIEFAAGLLTLVEFIVFGTLLSLIERRPLLGLAKAVALVISVRWIGFSLDFLAFGGFSRIPDFPWPSLTWRFVFLVAGIAFAIRFVKKWYADEPVRFLPEAIKGFIRRDVVTHLQIEAVHRGDLRRLIWLQYRVSIWPIAVLTVVGLLTAFVCTQPPVLFGKAPEYLIVLAVILMLIGTVAFSAANQNRQSLAVFGVRPSTLWLSQWGMPLAAGLSVMVAFVSPVVPVFKDNPDWSSWKALFFVGVYSGLAAMAWGQLASIRCKSNFAAIGYAAGSLIPACLWIACVVSAEAPFWLFVLPIISYPLVESLTRARRWFIEDRRVGIWWIVRVGLYLSLALGLIAYRYYEIPGVSQHELNRALSIVPRMNEAQTSRFRVLADALMDREAFEPTDVHNQFEIEQALRNNQYRWVANHRTLVDEIIDGPYLTSQFQAANSANEADRMRFATINEFTLAALETALHEGDVELGERIIRKIPINVSPTDTLRWCRMPMNDSKRIRRLAHQLQGASIFDRECRRVLLRQWLLPNLNEEWGKYYRWSIDHTSNLFEAAWLFIATDGFRWKRRARFFTVEAARQLEAILSDFPPQDEFAKLRELNRAKNPNAAPAKQITDEELPAIYALSVYSGVLGKLGGMSLQLAVVSWQMDHDGRLPDSLDELTIEYMPKLRFDPNGGANFIYEKDRHFAGEEIVVPGAKNYFVFVFGGGTRRIEVPFKVSTGNQRMRDSEGRFPPMIFSSKALKVQAFQIDTASWSIAGDAGQIFPLDLPAEETADKK